MILAIDTATRWTAIALHDGLTVRSEMGWQALNTTTQELAPTVADMFRRTNIAPADLTGVAVSIGPGSYTGLRVGVGFAKGFSLAHNLPLFGINTLDVVVASHGDGSGYLTAVCEAGRKRVCAASYRRYSRKGWQLKEEADIYTWEELIEKVPKNSALAGEISGDARRMIRAAGKQLIAFTPAIGTRRAGHLAELAYRRLRKRDHDDPAALAPIYLREPGGGRVKTSS